MQARADPDAGKRFLFRETLADLREHRHVRGRPSNARTAGLRERTVFDVAAKRGVFEYWQLGSFLS